MGQQLLQTRDIEIFRTLVRLEYLTTRQIQEAFFQAPRRARRRLHRLSELDFIAPHRKGLDPLNTYSAWRLTERGAGELARAIPSETIAVGFVQRVAETSLLHLHHHEALASIYLGLVTTAVDVAANDNDIAATRARISQMRGLAEQFEWQPDGAVTLRYLLGPREYQVVPDATVMSRAQAARVFLELDRSNKPLGRIARNLERYRLYCAEPYAKAFPDGRAPMVLYVVGHEIRQAGVRRLCERVLGKSVRWDVALLKDAVASLRTVLFGFGQLELPNPGQAEPKPERAPAASPELVMASRKACSWMMRHFKELHRQGLQQFFEASSIEEGVRRANVLYEQLERAGVIRGR